MSDYQLVEVEIEGRYKNDAVYRIAAKELWKEYNSEEWNIQRMLKREVTFEGPDKKTLIVFEIKRKKDGKE